MTIILPKNVDLCLQVTNEDTAVSLTKRKSYPGLSVEQKGKTAFKNG